MEEFFEEEREWNIMQLQKKAILRILKFNSFKDTTNNDSTAFDKQLV